MHERPGLKTLARGERVLLQQEQSIMSFHHKQDVVKNDKRNSQLLAAVRGLPLESSAPRQTLLWHFKDSLELFSNTKVERTCISGKKKKKEIAQMSVENRKSRNEDEEEQEQD